MLNSDGVYVIFVCSLLNLQPSTCRRRLAEFAMCGEGDEVHDAMMGAITSMVTIVEKDAYQVIVRKPHAVLSAPASWDAGAEQRALGGGSY